MNIKDKYLNFYYETIGEIEEPVINPKKTALLLVDLQNEFVLRDFGEALQFKASGEWERWIPFHDWMTSLFLIIRNCWISLELTIWLLHMVELPACEMMVKTDPQYKNRKAGTIC